MIRTPFCGAPGCEWPKKPSISTLEMLNDAALKVHNTRARLYQLERACKLMKTALKKYAEGSALMVKPEKRHLYGPEVETGSQLWFERSMSDFCDKLLAADALELVDELMGDE